MSDLRVSLLQTDIKWEDKLYNLRNVEQHISRLAGSTDLIVLPEMFSTGFSMNSRTLAEANDGDTISSLTLWAKKYDVAICGSFIATEGSRYYNRGFFVTNNGNHYYDKKHLFRLGNETKYFSAGNNHCVIEHKGFKICLLICYELRFPVWARNVDNEYDLLIYAANWPRSRMNVWNTLLQARAIENLAYVCGVNRVGEDGMKIKYNGQSCLVDFKGNKMLSLNNPEEAVATVSISKKELNIFREKFPVWKDADKFTLL